MNKLKRKPVNQIEKVAIKVTRFIGSTESLVLHTILFIISFLLFFWGVPINKILLVVTTLVSLEAIYLSIFIQMSVNRQDEKLDEVVEDVDEIQEDIDEIQKDVDEIQKDVDEIQEDVEDIQEDDEEYEKEEKEEEEILARVENTLGKLIEEVIELKKQHTETKTKTKKKQ